MLPWNNYKFLKLYIGDPDAINPVGNVDPGELNDTTEYLGIKLGFWGRIKKRSIDDERYNR